MTLHRTHTPGRFALHERGRAGLVVMPTVELLERVEFRGRMLARVKGREMPGRRLIRECGPGWCDGREEAAGAGATRSAMPKAALKRWRISRS